MGRALALLGVGVGQYSVKGDKQPVFMRTIFRSLVVTACISLLSIGAAFGQGVQPVHLWTNVDDSQLPLFQGSVDAFEAAYPQYRVEWYNVPSGEDFLARLAVAISTGVGPDVVRVRPGTDRFLRAEGLVVDLDDLVRRDAAEVAPEDFIPAQLAELQFDGRWWSLPDDYSVIALYYNTELFGQAGLTVPDEHWTWETVLDNARRLTVRDADGHASRYGLGNVNWMLSQWAEGFIMSNGGRLFNEETSAADVQNPGAIETLRFHARIGVEHEVTPLPGQQPNGENAWRQGRAAMTLQGSWAPVVIRSYAEFPLDVAMIPSGSEGRVVSATGGAWAIAEGARHLEASWELTKFLVSPDELRRRIVEPVRGIPARPSLFPEWAEAIATSGPPASAMVMARSVLEHGRNVPTLNFNLAGVLGSVRNPLLTGQISPEEAAARLEHALNLELERTR